MGWASYVEDMVTRYEGIWHQANKNLTSESATNPEKLEQAKIVLRSAEQFLEEIRKDLDLATDPQLDLANELRNARIQADIEKNRIRSELGRVKAQKKDIEQEKQMLEAEIIEIKAQLSRTNESLLEAKNMVEEVEDMYLEAKEEKEKLAAELEIMRSLAGVKPIDY